LPPTGWLRMLIRSAILYEWLPSIKVVTGQIRQSGLVGSVSHPWLL
jgi:hypothetical protein